MPASLPSARTGRASGRSGHWKRREMEPELGRAAEEPGSSGVCVWVWEMESAALEVMP